MNIININNKNFINCRSITDYEDKITSIYKDKCFLLLEEVTIGKFLYNVESYGYIKDFALIKIKDISYNNNFYFYYPESVIYTSRSNINLYDVFKTIAGKSGLTSSFELSCYLELFIDSCYLELTKELVYELE